MTSGFAKPAETSENANADKALHDQNARLRSLANNGDLGAFAQAAHDIHVRWVRRELDTTMHAHLMLHVIEELDSGKFNDDDQYTLAEHYRLFLLEGAEELSLDVEVKLLFHEVVAEYKSVEESRWPGERRRQAERILHGWRRLRGAIDPNWDFDHPGFVTNVPLPRGVRGPLGSGMSPKDIADPKLRAEYQRAIAENSKKAAEHLKQLNVLKLSQRFFPRAEAALVERYSRPPVATKELDLLLAEYLGDDPARDRIIKKAESNAQNGDPR